MNANEIAQEFEEYLKEIEELPWGNHQILCDQAATLLRQQQAEIEALKKQLTCSCGEPSAHHTVHRKDKPCYILGSYEDALESCKEVAEILRKAQEK